MAEVILEVLKGTVDSRYNTLLLKKKDLDERIGLLERDAELHFKTYLEESTFLSIFPEGASISKVDVKYSYDSGKVDISVGNILVDNKPVQSSPSLLEELGKEWDKYYDLAPWLGKVSTAFPGEKGTG